MLTWTEWDGAGWTSKFVSAGLYQLFKAVFAVRVDAGSKLARRVVQLQAEEASELLASLR